MPLRSIGKFFGAAALAYCLGGSAAHRSAPVDETDAAACEALSGQTCELPDAETNGFLAENGISVNRKAEMENIAEFPLGTSGINLRDSLMGLEEFDAKDHEARHVKQEREEGVFRRINASASPVESWLLSRFMEADGCGSAAFDVARAAVTNEAVRGDLLNHDSILMDVNIARDFYLASETGSGMEPTEAQLEENYIMQAFVPCLAALSVRGDYDKVHTDGAAEAAGRCRTAQAMSPAFSCGIGDAGDLDRFMQDRAFPGLSSDFTAGRRTADMEQAVSMRGILHWDSAPPETVRKIDQMEAALPRPSKPDAGAPGAVFPYLIYVNK